MWVCKVCMLPMSVFYGRDSVTSCLPNSEFGWKVSSATPVDLGQWSCGQWSLLWNVSPLARFFLLCFIICIFVFFYVGQVLYFPNHCARKVLGWHDSLICTVDRVWTKMISVLRRKVEGWVFIGVQYHWSLGSVCSSVALRGNKDLPTSLSKCKGEVDATLHCITNVSDF